jgi:hypothetical protein
MMMSAGPVNMAVLQFFRGGFADADHFDLEM